jgi:WD40 repeat protein
VRTATVRQTLAAPEHTGAILAFAADGQTLVAGGASQEVGIWEVRTGKLRRTVTELSTVHGLALSPDGKTLATVIGSLNRFVRFWDVATGRNSGLVLGDKELHSVTFSPDGKLLAGTGGPDLTVWDARTRKVKYTRAHEGSPFGIAFAADSKTFVSGGAYRLVLRDAETGNPRWSVATRGLVNSVVVAPDGKTLAVGEWRAAPSGRAWDYEVTLRDMKDGKILRSFAR